MAPTGSMAGEQNEGGDLEGGYKCEKINILEQICIIFKTYRVLHYLNQ